MKDQLLYHVDFEGTRRLYLPFNYVKPILELVYDKRHHFRVNKMMADLSNLYFAYKQ
ncbi:hypothetical protein C7999DRAFT_18587 [Corynascus novoguineensis]|uniref:Uncharacterized protein n=1 Tax=Corynascus novoguineensis TaxID=1126955 RepID=A0AAN7CJ01_9PEZI|nr:hypothetical protein C7999DRAFT_18587 [Corynascus novoguineensis]